MGRPRLSIADDPNMDAKLIAHVRLPERAYRRFPRVSVLGMCCGAWPAGRVGGVVILTGEQASPAALVTRVCRRGFLVLLRS